MFLTKNVKHFPGFYDGWYTLKGLFNECKLRFTLFGCIFRHLFFSCLEGDMPSKLTLFGHDVYISYRNPVKPVRSLMSRLVYNPMVVGNRYSYSDSDMCYMCYMCLCVGLLGLFRTCSERFMVKII